MTNHPNRSKTHKLAQLLRIEHRDIAVPRDLSPQQLTDLLEAGLIAGICDGYEATDYARNLIWGRL